MTATTNEPFIPIADGVEMRVLRRHSERGLSFLIRMARGAIAPLHEHPGGEETMMLAGRLRIRRRTNASGAAEPDVVVGAGEFVFVPPGEVHDGVAEEAALFFVNAPGGVAPRP